MAFNFVISIIGVSLVRQLPEHMKWSRFIGFCLAGTFTANFPLVMAMISGNFGGFTKKVSVNAVVSISPWKKKKTFIEVPNLTGHIIGFHRILYRQYCWTTAVFLLASSVV